MDRLYEAVYSRTVAAAVLLLSLIMLLSAGLHNVAKAFSSVKLGSSSIIHWGSALAIELGVVALGLTIAVRARTQQRSPRLQTGVLLFVAASMFANYDSSLRSLIGGSVTWQRLSAVDAWTLAKAGLLGGALPVMVLLVIEALRELAREATPLPQARPALHIVSSVNDSDANDDAVAESPTRIALTAPQGARDAFLALLAQDGVTPAGWTAEGSRFGMLTGLREEAHEATATGVHERVQAPGGRGVRRRLGEPGAAVPAV